MSFSDPEVHTRICAYVARTYPHSTRKQHGELVIYTSASLTHALAPPFSAVRTIDQAIDQEMIAAATEAAIVERPWLVVPVPDAGKLREHILARYANDHGGREMPAQMQIDLAREFSLAGPDHLIALAYGEGFTGIPIERQPPQIKALPEPVAEPPPPPRTFWSAVKRALRRFVWGH